MSALFKIDGYDLSAFVRVGPEDGLQPADPTVFEAQFGDAGGLEGPALIAVSARQAELAIPVHLSPTKSASFPATKDGLHELATDLAARLRVAQTLEWREDGASASTFRDVLFARFEPAYSYRKAGALWLSGVVRATTKPYGHTATSRIVATGQANAPAVVVTLPALDGDVPALADVIVTAGSQLAVEGRIVGAAALPSAYQPIWAPASMTALTGWSKAGASGAPASQTIANGLQTTDDSLVAAAELVLSPASAYQGRNRILAVTRGDSVRLSAFDRDGTTLGGGYASALASGGWGTVDCGVLDVDGSGLPDAPIRFGFAQTFDDTLRRTSNLNQNAQLAYVLVLPEDSLTLAVDTGRELLTYDALPSRSVATGTPYTADGLGQPVSSAANSALEYRPDVGGESLRVPLAFASGALAGAGVGQPQLDMQVEMLAESVSNQAYIGKGDALAVYRSFVSFKRGSSSSGAPMSLALAADFLTGVVASKAVPSVADNGWLVRGRWRGPNLDAELLSQSGAVLATITASHANFAKQGKAVIGLSGASFEGQISGYRVSALASQGYAPRDRYSLTATTDAALRLDSGGTPRADVGRGWRTGPLQVDPARHAKVVGFNLPLDGRDAANGLVAVDVRVRERFTYAR